MNTQNINEKTKIFVRYMNGSGGHFICLMLLSLIQDIKLIEPHRGHLNLHDIKRNHNFGNQWSEEFDKHTSVGSSLEDSISWIKDNFNFYPTQNEIYVVHTHAINPLPLMGAFENTKLINITFSEDDKNQLAFNWIIKSLYLHNQFDLMNHHLNGIKKHFKKLLNIPNNSLNRFTNQKLLTYIFRFSQENLYKEFEKCCFKNSNNMYNIKFSDIVNKTIINQLDDIVKFLGITVTQERWNATIKMIHDYADSQTNVPWKLTLEDYE
jgi:hypothetical protein